MPLSARELAPYLQGMRDREAARQQALHQRREAAIAVARECARILKERFGVQRVVLFGSMHSGQVWEDSDIDLGVWGLDDREYFAALAAIDISDFAIDLVPAERAHPHIASALDRGLPL